MPYMLSVEIAQIQLPNKNLSRFYYQVFLAACHFPDDVCQSTTQPYTLILRPNLNISLNLEPANPLAVVTTLQPHIIRFLLVRIKDDRNCKSVFPVTLEMQDFG